MWPGATKLAELRRASSWRFEYSQDATRPDAGLFFGGSQMGTITFGHQDGDLTFRVAKATFAVDRENRLTLSIRCEGRPEHSWMGDPSFCLVGFPLASRLAKGTVVRFAGNEDEFDFESEGPRAHVYVGIHQMPRDVEMRFTRVAGDECDVEFSWAQADVNYYDDRAKANRVAGRCTMRRGPVEEMWIPS
jgi:hypothetical protein